MSAGQGISGNLYDANYFNTSNQVWNGAAFVTWDDDDFIDYRTPMPETGTSGRFPLPTPPAGTTSWEMRIRGATLADSYVVWEGSLIADEVLKIPRAATAVTAGAPQQKHLENALGTTLQTVYEVHDGDLA